ncbi:DNA processing protein [Marinitoga hydrogenitolerans DSM 16785]|uniref:DNA processing protein n=1 Tax=Marinitoga hydrogenitolerans (strain DSM 16785 / JCM 12826 / AT1271) TaxID=1122195 RepID=A0A1M4S4N0_MARH1|nr:DNA-processing protein DprA [Marinitoga hydrogenitolerans]SHE27158.1 DNA processing protein [Marinitoga hydrogenitolerans DSM 16785]
MVQNSIIWMKEFLKESNEKIIKNIKNKKIPLIDENQLNKFYDSLEKKEIKIITYFDPEYPETLKRIFNPPLVLYVKGNTDLLNKKGIGIVGSRKYTSYGKNIALSFSEILAKQYIIISGMAYGIDSFAHKGALKSGNTIAVLGSGIDKPYPVSNTTLYNDILKNNGCIISEYAPGTPAQPFRFPERNRIIVGLSNSIIVIEAAKKSGSLITARLAIESGIDVYAVPGDINRKSSEGTNNLIFNGAIPIISETHLKELFNINNNKIINIEDPLDKKIIAAIINGYESFEKIIYYTNESPSIILQRLTILIMEDIILEDNGIYYYKGG